jgi:hypothetical protein|nr:MAG TPA: hypothetical protein [Caudoviricetes sp.]
MNISLFVGLCEDAGLNVEFRGGITYIYGDLNEHLADISEARTGDYYIDLWNISKEYTELISEIVPEYSLTPIEERE